MRALIFTTIGLAALAGGAFLIAEARPFPSGPYQIYIEDTGERDHVYAIARGRRARAVLVTDCQGRLADDPSDIVADLRRRAARKDPEDSVVRLIGAGSDVSLGACGISDDPDPEDEDGEHGDGESLVVVTDASAAQTRRIIGEIPLSDADRQTMMTALALE